MKFVVVWFLLSSIIFAESLEEKGTRISYKNNQINNGFKSQVSNMTMTLINAHKDRVTRKMIFKSKEVENDGDKTLITFEYPLDVKQTKLLTWAHKDKNDDQWLFLPGINRVKRINSSNKSGSFMGSEFSYEDISSDEVEKYTYKFIQDQQIASRDVWVIIRYPKDSKSGYSKQITYTDKQYRQPLKIDYYDRKDELLKTAIFSQFQLYESWWFYNKISMINHQTQKKSLLVWQNRKIGEIISDTEFTKRALQ